MTRLGYVVDGRMVNLIVDNEKLQGRAEQIVSDLAQSTTKLANEALINANGDVKLAILIASNMKPQQAESLLREKDGNLRQALAEVQASN
ncbi:MAG TPA: hypothetical protein DCS30_13200 [Rhizobiales bacterium]|nr:hypothetical protein [Hyphomicrobiales bacterium]